METYLDDLVVDQTFQTDLCEILESAIARGTPQLVLAHMLIGAGGGVLSAVCVPTLVAKKFRDSADTIEAGAFEAEADH
jgi:hypothetical protein